MSDINCCWFSIELDCIILPLFLLKTLNIGFSLNCFIMFHFRITVIKVYAILFKAAVHFHDRPSKFFFQCLNPSSTSCGNVNYGFIRSLDSHLFFFFFVCQVSEYDGLLYLDHLAALIYFASGTFFIAY